MGDKGCPTFVRPSFITRHANWLDLLAAGLLGLGPPDRDRCTSRKADAGRVRGTALPWLGLHLPGRRWRSGSSRPGRLQALRDPAVLLAAALGEGPRQHHVQGRREA